MRVAFVHDWLTTYRGGEKVLESLIKLFPEAPIYTLFYDPNRLPKEITSRRIIFHRTLNSMRPLRKLLLPLLPSAIESFDFSHYDLIISTSSCVAKGAIGGPYTKHISYIHSPMRYIWDQRNQYLQTVKKIPGLSLLRDILWCRMRLWDQVSSQRVNVLLANSTFVQQRIRSFYGRNAQVLHPPVDIDRFVAHPQQKQSFVIAAGAFVSYKRFDIAIEACRKANRSLVIAGSGPEEAKLRKLAGKDVHFEIDPNNARFTELIAQAQALVMPGIEDFGIIAIESIAAGTPVIAFEKGGAQDFIIDGVTGKKVSQQTSEAFASILSEHKIEPYDKMKMRDFARRFSEKAFLERFRLIIKELEASS